MINCLTVAGHITSFEEDAPRIAGNGYPFFGNTSNLNDASLACYKNNICPKLGEYVSCFQCNVDARINLVASGREDATKSVNRDLPRISSLCEKVGVSVKYTSVVVNGAMTATAGSILLAFGVAVASFL